MNYIFVFIILTWLVLAAPPVDPFSAPTVAVTTASFKTSTLSSAVVSEQTPLAPPFSACAPCAPCAACPVCPPRRVPPPVTVSDDTSPSPPLAPPPIPPPRADSPAGTPASQITTTYLALVGGVLTFLNVWGKNIALLLLNLAAKKSGHIDKFRRNLAEYTEGLDETLKKQREGDRNGVNKLRRDVARLTKENEKLVADISTKTTLIDTMDQDVRQMKVTLRRLGVI